MKTVQTVVREAIKSVDGIHALNVDQLIASLKGRQDMMSARTVIVYLRGLKEEMNTYTNKLIDSFGVAEDQQKDDDE